MTLLIIVIVICIFASFALIRSVKFWSDEPELSIVYFFLSFLLFGFVLVLIGGS